MCIYKYINNTYYIVLVVVVVVVVPPFRITIVFVQPLYRERERESGNKRTVIYVEEYNTGARRRR
jgi:hypothetical protein